MSEFKAKATRFNCPLCKERKLIEVEKGLYCCTKCAKTMRRKSTK